MIAIINFKLDHVKKHELFYKLLKLLLMPIRLNFYDYTLFILQTSNVL